MTLYCIVLKFHCSWLPETGSKVRGRGGGVGGGGGGGGGLKNRFTIICILQWMSQQKRETGEYTCCLFEKQGFIDS